MQAEKGKMGAGEEAEENTQPAEKYFLATECLIEGFVQAYVDLFYLTHSSQAALAEADMDKQEPDLSTERLHFLKFQLTTAEAAKREGNMKQVYLAYKALAEHYEAEGDYQTCIYFTEKGLEIARLSEDVEAEADANRSLGLAYEQLGNTAMSIEFHEKQRSLANASQNTDDFSDANKHLIDVYKAYAEACEQKGEYEKAVEYHEKCLEAARQCDDENAESLAIFQLGRAHHALSKHDMSLAHFEKYYAMCQEAGDKVGEGNACYALADAHQAAGEVEEAIKFLESYHEIAQMTGELASQGEACSRLGVIYHTQGDFTNSVHYFEKAFEMARSLGDQKGVAIARVNLGIARGQAKHQPFMKVVNNDLPALIKWKNRRTPFDDAAK